MCCNVYKNSFLTNYCVPIIEQPQTNMTMAVTSQAMMPISVTSIAIKLTLIHIMAILFASIIIVVSALLGKFAYTRATNYYMCL